MKHKPSLTLFSALLLAGLTSACQPAAAPAPPAATPAVAASESTPAADPTSPQVAAAAEHAATEAPADAAIPATADAIWQVVDAKRAALKSAIEAKQLDQVHHLAFAIRDHIAALPTRTPSLSEEDKAKLDGEIGFVTTLADRLDQAGDSGDQAGARENFDKLAQVLDGMTRYK